MSKQIMTLNILPSLLLDQPEVVGRLLADKVRAQPDAFWLILLADYPEANAFMEFHVWHAGPPQELGV